MNRVPRRADVPKITRGAKRDQTGIRHLADACDLVCVTRVATQEWAAANP